MIVPNVVTRPPRSPARSARARLVCAPIKKLQTRNRGPNPNVALKQSNKGQHKIIYRPFFRPQPFELVEWHRLRSELTKWQTYVPLL
eukprot:6255142-Prymnesium_polylepis.1